MMTGPVVLLSVFLGCAVMSGLFLSMYILKEYERAVVFRWGKLHGLKGPGVVFLIPFVEILQKMDTRIVCIEVARQEVITRDNVPLFVDAVVYYRVSNPVLAVTKVFRFIESTFLIAQTTLRSVIGQSELDELLSKREQINQRLREIIDRHTEPWGIEVSMVEIKDITLPETMKRAMAKQAEAERERRAKIIYVDGELAISHQLVEAGNTLSSSPLAFQLRYLQVLSEMANSDNKSTILIPSGININQFLEKQGMPINLKTEVESPRSS